MADDVFHATFTRNLPDIQERGLDPLSESLWLKQGTGERYQQEPSVYSFSDPGDALRWASKMRYAFGDESSSPADVSIVRLRGGEHWHQDPSEDVNLVGGSSRRSLQSIAPQDVLEVISVPEPAGINEEFQRAVPGGGFDEWIQYYGNRIKEPRSTEQATVPETSSERLIELRQAADPPRLPEIIHEPETPRITPGRAFRGLGSLIGPGSKLKAVKRLFTLAQQGYQLLPEELQLLGDVLDMEALKKPIDFGLGRSEYPPGFKGGLDYFRQMLGMGPEEGGITSLPMDEASRTARAEEQGFNLDTYHATRDDFTTFEKGDLGYHFGTKEHANNRLERTRKKTLLHPDGDYTGEKILPTKIRLTNPLELFDVGDWKDPKTIAASALRPSRATGYSGEWGKAHEEELTEIIDTVTDYFDDFKFADKKEFKESPEAAELVGQIRDMIIEDGYDGVKYYNVAEADFNEEGKLILEHSYIVFDPKNIRSRFAKFDPEESKSADILKAAGGFVDKPLHGGWNDVF